MYGTTKPTPPESIRQIVLFIFKFRRQLIQIKQAFSSAELSNEPIQPTVFILKIIQKKSFLLSTNSPLHDAFDSSTITDVLDQIISFLSSNSSLETYFIILQTTESSRSNVSLGIALI
jgi:hypothetical protein